MAARREMLGAHRDVIRANLACAKEGLALMDSKIAPQLKINIEHACAAGAGERETVEAIGQMVAYSDLPAAINGLNTAREVFAVA